MKRDIAQGGYYSMVRHQTISEYLRVQFPAAPPISEKAMHLKLTQSRFLPDGVYDICALDLAYQSLLDGCPIEDLLKPLSADPIVLYRGIGSGGKAAAMRPWWTWDLFTARMYAGSNMAYFRKNEAAVYRLELSGADRLLLQPMPGHIYVTFPDDDDLGIEVFEEGETPGIIEGMHFHIDFIMGLGMGCGDYQDPGDGSVWGEGSYGYY